MEDRVTLAEAFSALAGYGPALWCGVAAGIATFIVEVILCTKGILFAGADRKLALAKQRGHMLTATRTSLRFRTGSQRARGQTEFISPITNTQ